MTETKLLKKVSEMKKQITEEAVKSLEREGLKFSIDALAEKLKISKKTVYKYFPDKEALAFAVYENYYSKMSERVENLQCGKDGDLKENLLLCYFESQRMVRKEIFNKYNLNDIIRAYALKQHEALWAAIKPAFNFSDENENTVLKIIADGTFEKLSSGNFPPSAVIKKLVTLL